ncbi:hypothetical protein GQ53DRAFT_836754 [Thozetella sp. PMI_491]|nr:hypothetical protein GQ53DRAFT_836754 [Thozetella sp. PMI_491]
MSTLDLTIDSVDNAAAYGIGGAHKRESKSLSPWIKSVFSSNKPLRRNVFVGGTDYSEAGVATILRDFLQPNTKLSPQDAAKSLLTLIPANAPGNAEVCSFGEICVELAEQIPYHHPSQLKFTQLLHVLAMSPKFMYKYSLIPGEEGHQPFQLLWESLSDSFSGPDIDKPTVWINLNAFMANLFATGIWGDSLGKAVEMLREAFESQIPEEVWERDCNTMAAAQWILWHGQSIFKLVIYDYFEIDASEKWRWRLGNAFPGPPIEPRSIGRWRFWKAGFEAVENASNASEECKTTAKRAARMMASLEEGMLF